MDFMLLLHLRIVFYLFRHLKVVVAATACPTIEHSKALTTPLALCITPFHQKLLLSLLQNTFRSRIIRTDRTTTLESRKMPKLKTLNLQNKFLKLTKKTFTASKKCMAFSINNKNLY